MGARGINATTRAQREEMLAAGRDVLPWDIEGLSRVDRVVAFLEDLPITQGKLAGTRMQVRPWQREWLEGVFGEGGTVRTALLSLPRKNGKTGLIAGLALCALVGPEAQPRGEVYAVATNREQAAKIYFEMVAILEDHLELGARCNVVAFRREIQVVVEGPGYRSNFKVLSSDAKSLHGLNPSFVAVDELAQHDNRRVYEAMDTAMGGRDSALLCVISTQAQSDTELMSELCDYALKLETGELEDPTFYGKVYAAPLDADPWDEATWHACNPALGDFKSLDDMRRQAGQAQRLPSLEQSFRNLQLNQRISSHVRFLSSSEWDANSELTKAEKLRGAACYGGLDLSASRDLTAFVLVFPDHAGRFDVLSHFFMPQENLRERSEQDRVPYSTWAQQGFLTAIPGPVIDPEYVAEAMADAAATYNIEAVAYDRWRIELLRKELDKTGARIELTEHGQGFRDMAPAVDTLERLVVEKRLRHGGQPVLRMCASNAVVTRDAAGNRKLDKSKANGRIDGLVALAMALAVAERGVEKYEPRLVVI